MTSCAQGVFILVIEKSSGDISCIVSAITGWLISAGILLTLFSALICKTSLDSSYIGYISSFISFASAAIAGAYSYRHKKRETLISSAVTALFVVILLLTIGFLIRGEDMTPAGIISVSSFTFAGLLLGANTRHLLGKKGKKSINYGLKNQKRR